MISRLAIRVTNPSLRVRLRVINPHTPSRRRHNLNNRTRIREHMFNDMSRILMISRLANLKVQRAKRLGAYCLCHGGVRVKEISNIQTCKGMRFREYMFHDYNVMICYGY